MAKRRDLTRIQQEVVDLLGLDLNYVSPKGWIYNAPCPFCGEEGKFGVRINEKRANYSNQISFNCFKGSCGEKGTEYHLLKIFNRDHLLSQRDYIKSTREPLESLLEPNMSDDSEIDIEVETRQPPLGWTRVSTHPYLVDRGWEPWQFELYKVGVTDLYYSLKGYVVILMEEDGENKGYVARSTQSKEWIDDHNEKVKLFNKTAPKEKRKRLHPRYNNEGGVYFEKMLWGIDEVVTGITRTVILVEGPLDKTNTDKELQLNTTNEVKCCCTFGKKISKAQIKKLMNKGVSNIMLLYDPDAIESSKQFGNELEYNFEHVKIAYHPEKDPGDLKREEFMQCFEQAKSFINFYAGMVDLTKDLERKVKFKKR